MEHKLPVPGQQPPPLAAMVPASGGHAPAPGPPVPDDTAAWQPFIPGGEWYRELAELDGGA